MRDTRLSDHSKGRATIENRINFLKPASPSELAQWTEEAARLIEGAPPVFRLDALKRLGWCAVAVEDELEKDSAQQLGHACADAALTSAWALEVPWAPANWTLRAYHVPLTFEGIEAASKEALIGSGFVLVEQSGRFAVTSDGDGYWMLAASRRFIEAALEATVPDLHATFAKVVAVYRGEATLSGQRLGAAQAVAVASYR